MICSCLVFVILTLSGLRREQMVDDYGIALAFLLRDDKDRLSVGN